MSDSALFRILARCFFMINRVAILFLVMTVVAGISHAISAQIPQNGRPNIPISLTDDEKAWLKSHQALRVAGPKAFPPFHFYDDSGVALGIASDYLDLITRFLNIKTETTAGLLWPDVLKKTKGKEIDLITLCATSSAREEYLDFTRPFLSYPLVIVTRIDAPFVSGIKDLHGKKIVLVKGNATHDWLVRDEIAFIPQFADTPADALNAVSLGEAEAAIENLAAVTHLIQSGGLANLKIAAPTPYGQYELFMAVRKDWPELTRILNKVLSAITPEQHAEIRNRWLSVRYEHGIKKSDIVKWVTSVSAILLAILATFLFWNWRLKKEIRDRRLAENALRENEEKYRRLFENELMAICIFDLETLRFVDVNETYVQLYGYSREELIGSMTIHDITVEHTSSEEATRKAESAGTIHIPLRLHKKKNGTVFPVEIVGGPYSLKGRKVMFGMMRDITERKQAEETQEKLQAQIARIQKAESLGRMAGAIAHIFNNQLGVVIGNLEMALVDLPQDAQPVRKLNAAMQGALNAAQVSSLMLTYLGQTTGSNVPMDLSEFCRQSLPSLRAGTSRNIVLNVNLPSPGPTIKANANQIQQMLTNLITNAREAVGEKQGTVTLSVKTVPQTDISEVLRYPTDWQAEDAAYACLEVTDTGGGIADEAIDKIFDPFFSTKFTGRGLGLPVVFGIVRAHDGVITVASENQGSTFRIFLPLSAEEIPRQPGKTAQPFVKEGRSTVLLIEDEEMIRDMAKTMVEFLGYTVLAAKDGIEAMEMFARHQDKICCVISDVTMPRMNGWETLTALRGLSPGIPVILCSGYDEAQVLVDDHSERPQAFLHKPYQKAELQAVLARAMKG
jgi:two-component system cell cycle sensor histidine kinase/response regulator CckA